MNRIIITKSREAGATYNRRPGNRFRRVVSIITILEILAGNISCKKFVQVAAPETQIAGKTVFSDDKAALSAAAGIYADMGVSNLYIMSGGMTAYTALSADELAYTSYNTNIRSFQNNAIAAENNEGIYTQLWVPAYRYIYYANSILEGVAGSQKLSAATRDQLTGEMLVVRALNYFCLVNLFGDVPLETGTDYRVNRVMPRTPVPQVYDQVINDLLKAKALLAEAYTSAFKARPNKWAAAALLSGIYLYNRDWINAEAQASSVINSNKYSLETNLDNVFTQSAAETIWQLANDNHNTGEGMAFVPYSASGMPSYVITGALLNAFEANDERFGKWLGSNTIDSNVYYYPYKYKVRDYDPVTEFYIVFRLAEQYLIRAEARAQQGNIDGAVNDINTIRARAGLPAVTASDKDSVLSAVWHERQVELFCEWGHRWCDLKRTGRADEVLGIEKAPGWQATDSVYPLPSVELFNNPFLTQNPGY